MNRSSRWPGIALPIVAVAAAFWSLLPMSVWLLGTDAGTFLRTWELWGWGALVTAGTTAVVVLLSKGKAGAALVDLWRRGPGLLPTPGFVALAAGLFAVGSLLFTHLLFSANPRNVDGFAQLFQGRIFLAGRLWAAPPAETAHFATLHMIVGPERWFSQYPPGQSLVLAFGLGVGAWWILNPLFGVVMSASAYGIGRWVAGETVGRLSALLLCLSPFALAVAGSEMSHLPAAALGISAAAVATRLDRPRWWLAALCAGALLGIMTEFRPLDAVAAAVPVGVIAALVARRRLAALLLIGFAGVVSTVPTLWYNLRTTGAWTEFGYTYLWGPNHSLGFHQVPWGLPLTLSRAVGLTGLDLHQLNQYLLDLPFPVLLLITAGYLTGRRSLGVRDAVPLVGAGALMGLLFFYWHRDVFYGPRFLFSALPWFIIAIARSIVLLRRMPRTEGRRYQVGGVALTAVSTAVLVGAVMLTPARLEAYRESTPVLDLHPDRDARQAGLMNAVVVIPDGWGSRLIARMWAAGVPVPRSTRLYAAIDACTLQETLDAADRESVRGERLVARLDSLAALGRAGGPARLTEDLNLRLRPDAPLTAACQDEITFDRRGFLSFAPFLYLNNATLDGDIVWARDMRNSNQVLFRRYPDRAFYRYSPDEPGGVPRLVPLPPIDQR